MVFQAELAELFLRGRRAGTVAVAVEMSGDSQTSCGFSGSDEFENFLIAGQRLTGPVFRYFREETVFDGIPLGSTGGIVGDGDFQSKRVAELRLDFSFPGKESAAITASSVSKDKELFGTGKARQPFLPPPTGDRMDGEGGSVVGEPNVN